MLITTATLHAQVIFQISSATSSVSGAATVPAGANGAQLTLSGTLPTVAQETSPGYLGCFYTGYGSTAGIALSAPNPDGTEPLTVPASTIQSVPQAQFTAANGFSVTALVYIVPGSAVCDGNSANAVSNQFPLQIVAPSLGAYGGPVSIPQINSAIDLQAAPLALTLPANGVLTGTASGGTTSVTFGTFGSVNVTPSASAVSVPVPPAFASSPVGTSASLSICNTLTGNTAPVCTTPTPAITLTVTALVPSSGSISATPNPVQTNGQTVLSAQFSKSSSATAGTNPGAPSGPVSFVADGTPLAPAILVLDTTATFAAQTSSITTTPAPTPVIAPKTGAYTGAQNITITDSASTATIYYTQDGSTPTNGSTVYTGPFSISTSQTVSAIAAVPGDANSAVASATYRITIRPATQLAFQVQAANAILNTAIAPAVQVAVEDSTGAVVTNSTAPVTLGLYSDPNNGVLSGTLTVNAVNGIATFSDLTINALGTGYEIRAYSGTLTAVIGTPFNVTPPAITMAVQSELVGIGSTLNGTFTLGAPAPAGGLVVSFSSGTPANVTIAPASVTVPVGQTAGTFTYSGVAAGDSILSASAPSYTTGTVKTTGTAAQVSLGLIPNVAPAQMQSIALSLATAAPAGGTTVTFTIANPNIATVSTSSFIPAGQQTPAANPQVTGVLIGTTTVTANAPGYAPATRPVVVTVTAAINPGTTYINLATATTTSLTISAPAPPGGIVFTLSSDSPAIATIPASVTIPAGATSVPISITGVSSGSTTIRADSTGITEATGTVNVQSQIGTSTFITGYDLESYTGLYLPVGPSAPTTVTITSSDPTVAVISTSSTVAGQTTMTYPNTTSNYIGTIWIQGLKIGTATLNITAPGYNAGSIVVTVNPSGFLINGYELAFSTTTYSSPTTLTIYPAVLNADLSYSTTSTLNPQSPTISIPVTSSSPSIGTVTSPAVYQATQSSQTVSFTPVAAGTTNINLGAPPAGFSVPTQNQQPENQQSVATVTTPVITVNPYTAATKLQGQVNLYLPEPPPAAVTVTVTSSDATKATLSASDTTAGTGTLTYSVAAGQNYIGTLWIQGQAIGSSTLTVAAPGYTSGSNTITVDTGGFLYYYTGSFTTTTFSSPTGFDIVAAALDPTSLQYTNYGYEVNPGLVPLTVPLTNSTPATGTVTNGGFVFNAGTTVAQTTFQPAAAGTTNIAIGAVAGFSLASPAQTLTATVTAPTIQVNNVTTGVKLQNTLNIYLPVSPPSGETVTVTIGGAGAVATMSNSQTTAGVTTLTFPNVTSSYVGTVYIQGQGVGTATITESAPGYTTGTAVATVNPSGFAFYGPPTFTTTTFSSSNNITVYTAILDPNTFQIQNYDIALNPGVTATVNLTDSATSVGTISANALVFNTGDGSHYFSFQPVSAGTTNLSINTPAGFTTPLQSQNPSVPQNQSGTVTVTAPVIQVNPITTGLNLEGALNIYLPQTPPNPVTVTVTSSGPQIATLSTDATVAGTSSVTFNNVTSTYVGTIYVQGQGLGTAQITETAPGYIDGSNTVTVNPSGFVFYYGGPPFTSSISQGNYDVNVYTAVLAPGTLTIQQIQLGLNPGAGNVSVPLSSSAPLVGTFVTNPIVFTPGAGYITAQFTPLTAGTTTIGIGTPASPAGFSTPSQNTSGTVTVQP